MTQIADKKESLVSHFTRSIKLEPEAPLPWLDELRRASVAHFHHKGFPTSKEEAWRHTNLAPICKTQFETAQPELLQEAIDLKEEFSFGAACGVELVFVNGIFVPELSSLGELPLSATVDSLADVLADDAGLIEKHLGQHADIERNPFVALNTGHIRDGAFLFFASGTVIEEPIHLLFISTASETPTISHPRVLLIAEDRVNVTLVKSFVGSKSGTYFCNAVTEIIVGKDCVIDHNKLQQEGDEGMHVSTTQVHLGERSNFISHVATLGGRLTRNDLNVVMGGEGAEATLNGLAYLRKSEHCDNHTLLDHAKPNCSSHELYKHVLDDKSTGVFKGKILVRQDSQKTDSKQTSKTLLLNDDAQMNSQPALEIYADDVKCTHGTTIGPVDEEQVFYLRSRGVGLDAARHLLTYAFAADVTRRIKVEPVRQRLEDFMAAQQGLPQDLRITDLGSHDDAARNL